MACLYRYEDCETESLILAAQDQVLNTKYYNASILGGSDPACRLCGSEIETVAQLSQGALLWLAHCIRSVIMK